MDLFEYEKLAKEEYFNIEREIAMVNKKIAYLSGRVGRLRTLQNLLQTNHSSAIPSRIEVTQLDLPLVNEA